MRTSCNIHGHDVTIARDGFCNCPALQAGSVSVSPPPSLADPAFDPVLEQILDNLRPFSPSETQRDDFAHQADEARQAGNPLLGAFYDARAGQRAGSYAAIDQFYAREHALNNFAYAIPNEEALAAIAHFGPVMDVGAGTGYWASLLAQRGVDVIASDIAPPVLGSNDYWRENRPRHFTEISEELAVEVAATNPDRALMLVWPPYDSPMASETLAAYEGDTLIYVGEGYGGCTGDDTFHQTLEDDWEIAVEVAIPQWAGIHDSLTIYTRIVAREFD